MDFDRYRTLWGTNLASLLVQPSPSALNGVLEAKYRKQRCDKGQLGIVLLTPCQTKEGKQASV